jgi:hypothetical protein
MVLTFSVLCIVTRIWAGLYSVQIPAGARGFFCSQKCLDWLWDAPGLIFTGYIVGVGWGGCYQQSVGGFFFVAFWEIQRVFFHQFPDHEVPLKKDTFSMMRYTLRSLVGCRHHVVISCQLNDTCCMLLDRCFCQSAVM